MFSMQPISSICLSEMVNKVANFPLKLNRKNGYIAIGV